MKKLLLILGIGIFLISCEKETSNPVQEFRISNLTTSNYPKVDGSTSTEPLQVLIACKLFNIDYAWVYVVIRKDLEQSSNAYQLYDLLLDRSGQRVVGESGYVPYY